MRWPDGERLYLALVVVVLGVAALVYLASVPRNPASGALAQGAAAMRAPAPQRRAAPRPPAVELVVTVWPRGAGGPHARWNVSCPPMSAPCRTALARRAMLDGDLRGPCRSRRSGPAEALVVGTIAGRHIAAWVDQRDGCGAARWQALLPLVGVRPTPMDRGKSARN